jgi:hypothetical protein
MARYVYVTEMGCLYRLTKTAWKRYLKERIINEHGNLDKYGDFLQVNVESVTDMSTETARDLLEEMS